MKRIISILLVTVIMLSMFLTVPVLAAVDNSKYIPKIIKENGKSNLVFDPETVKLAKNIAYDTYSLSESKKAKSTAKTLNKEGFVDIQQNFHEGNFLDNYLLADNFHVGVKTFEVNGEKKHILAIAFRGSKDAGDWHVNLAGALSYDGFHIGFYTAADDAHKTLRKMSFDSLDMTYDEYLNKAKTTDDYYILVAGHSLGGAIANIYTGEFLRSKCGIKDSAICYTFASPTVCKASKATQASATNIFNIINTEDTVPKTGYIWGEGARFGKDLKVKVTNSTEKAHNLNVTYEKAMNQVINNIGSMYKYTVFYYNELYGDKDDDVNGDNGSGTGNCNVGNNNVSLGKSVVGSVDIPSSWENLSIRSGPGTSYSIVGSMNDGVCCNVYPDKTKNGWYYVEYNGVYGYASGNRINTGSSGNENSNVGNNNVSLGNCIVGVVDIPSSWDNLSIRTGPSTNYQIVGSMNDGVKCNVYPSKTQNGWYYVEYNGIYGYASGKQINTSNSSAGSTTTTPAGISLSTSNVNLSYPGSPSQTITVTATGDLPNTYTFSLEMDGYVHFNWGSWSGNSIPLTFTVHENSNSCTPKIHLKDSASGNICATISFNVNVSVTKPVAKEYVNVYFDSKGGSVEYAMQTVGKYGTISIPTKKPSKSGYEFLGWSTDRNALSALYLSGDTVNVGNTDLTFYAVYKEEEASWDEWDLSLSEKKLYFNASDSKKVILVKLLEHNGKKEGVDYDLKITKDDHLAYEWGDSWYDEDGYRCTELEIYNPKKKLDKQQVSVLLRDEDGYVASSKNFSVIYEEKQAVLFADRNQTGISVYLNGKKLVFDVQPQIINGRTMVPMRKIFEELGTVVGWNNNTRTAVAVRKGDVVRIGIGGQYMTCNGEQKMLDSPAVVISGRTLVPVRAIAESLNCDVEWYDYGVNQVVDINMKDTVNKMENIGGLLIGWCEYAPFSYLDEDGTLIGFDTELAEYVCKFWGWNVAFTEIPFDEKFTAIKSGRIDCYWNGVTRTEEREELCTFTDEYVSFDMQYEEDGEWYTSHEVYSVPFRKGDYDTVQLVNIALEEAKKDGTIEHLKFKYGIK